MIYSNPFILCFGLTEICRRINLFIILFFVSSEIKIWFFSASSSNLLARLTVEPNTVNWSRFSVLIFPTNVSPVFIPHFKSICSISRPNWSFHSLIHSFLIFSKMLFVYVKYYDKIVINCYFITYADKRFKHTTLFLPILWHRLSNMISLIRGEKNYSISFLELVNQYLLRKLQ